VTSRRCAVLLLFAGAFALTAVSRIACAQDYPARPITMIVPFPPGGPNDTLGRIMAERMRPTLGQPSAIYALPYDTVKDFEPLVLLATSAPILVGRVTLPANNLKELIGWMKANPDKATMGTVGPGSPPHVAGIALQNLTHTRFRFVPYRGTAPALQDMIAGQIDLVIDSPVQSLPQARAGKIKAYAVLGKDRYPSAPDIPTTDDAGLPGFHLTVWNALWAVKGTPKDIINKLNAAAVEALADPAVQKRFGELGQNIPPRAQQTPEALGALQKADIETWWPVVKGANIKGE